MNDELLSNYDKQLNFISEVSQKFSKLSLEIADNIDRSNTNIADPHAARFIEAFALLNARVDCKLDQDLNFFKTALSNHTYPQHQAALPTMAIAQIHSDIESLGLNQEVPRGALLVSDAAYDSQCYFTTCYPLTLSAVKILQVKLKNKILTISVKFLSKTPPNKLRFYINASLRRAALIYELLFNHVASIDLKHASLQPVGFNAKESLLPNNAKVFSGHNLLTDYFVLPEKFLFFDLYLPDLKANELDINIKLNKTNADLETNITSDIFLLNCTPIINLYPQMAEPIVLNHFQIEHRLVPDIKMSAHNIEIYSVNSVKIKNTNVVNYLPFYGNKYNSCSQSANYSYLTKRGDQYFLALTNTTKNFKLHNEVVIESELLCTNGDIPMRLPYGGGEPRLHLISSKAVATCLTPFTHNHYDSNLSLILHLLTSYSFFNDSETNLSLLMKIINLYDFKNENQLDSALLCLTTNTIKKRVRADAKNSVYLTGTEINLVIDPSRFVSSSLFLFGSVLSKFFSQFCEINSFTELVISSKQQGEIYRFT